VYSARNGSLATKARGNKEKVRRHKVTGATIGQPSSPRKNELGARPPQKGCANLGFYRNIGCSLWFYEIFFRTVTTVCHRGE
jgi:hypothetical protein